MHMIYKKKGGFLGIYRATHWISNSVSHVILNLPHTVIIEYLRADLRREVSKMSSEKSL